MILIIMIITILFNIMIVLYLAHSLQTLEQKYKLNYRRQSQ